MFCINFDKTLVGLHIGRFLSQTHRVTIGLFLLWKNLSAKPIAEKLRNLGQQKLKPLFFS
jgi:hypothetical protein